MKQDKNKYKSGKEEIRVSHLEAHLGRNNQISHGSHTVSHISGLAMKLKQ